MKAIKKISMIILFAMCTAAVFGGVIAYASDNAAIVSTQVSTSKTTIYEYALLGDEYQVEEGLVSATDPKGNSISVGTDSVLLDWSQDSYSFEYENKIVNLKVYESAPQVSAVFDSENPTAGVAGIEMEFSAIAVYSNIVRTDGAPDVGEYAVKGVFWHGGERISTIKNVEQSFTYTPYESGLYVLSYEYTDVFGRVRNIDYPFSVSDERIIISELNTRYAIGDKATASAVHGYYKGKKYGVNIAVLTPSGKNETFTNSYTFVEEGSYTLTLSADIEGEKVEKTVSVFVNSGLNSYITDMFGFELKGDVKNYSNVGGEGVSRDGIMLDMTSSSAGFSYNGVIDLEELGKETPVISFTTNNTYAGTITKVQVTLTDVYDSKNAVTITFSANSDMTATSYTYDNTLIRATFGSVSTAFSNYYPLKTDSVGWDTTFYTYWNSPSYDNSEKTYDTRAQLYTMNFSYDASDDVIYSYGNFRWYSRPDGEQTGVKWWPVAYLSDSSLASTFGGFTTGEVYLSFKVVSGRGDIIIDSIGGKDFSVEESEYNSSDGILLEDFDGSIPAVVGTPYSLPAGSSDYISSLTRTLYLGDKQIALSGNSFTPTEAGTYKLVFSGTNQFGRTVKKEVRFECLAEKIPIEIMYDVSSDAKLGEVYTVKKPTITGGHGNVFYTISVNGKTVSVGQSVVVDGQIKVTVSAVDELGFTTQKTFDVVTDCNVLLFDVEFPRAAFYGETFTFPRADITYGTNAEKIAYEIYYNNVKQTGEQVVLPSADDGVESVEVRYVTDYGEKAYTLALKSEAITSGGDAMLDAVNAETSDEGTKVVLSASSGLSMPFAISSDDMRFEFFILEEDLNYNTLTLRLTSVKDVGLTISLTDLTEDTVKLLINGEEKATVSKRVQTFSSTASEGYAGKNYYAFSIMYNDWYKAVLSGSKILAYVEEDGRGVAFEGFGGGVYLDIYPGDFLSGSSAEIVVTRIGNQLFYSSSFESGDITGPALYSPSFRLGNENVEAGYVLDVSGVTAYDVLRGSATVTVSLTDPAGNTVYKDVSPAEAGKATLSEVGIYVLRVVAKDGAGVVSTANYRFSVEDEETPVITLGGQNVSTAQKGSSVTLASATAADSSSVTLKIVVIMPTGEIEYVASGTGSVEAVSYTFKRSGSYRIFYYATDEYGNVSSVTYTIKVEG